LDNNIYINIKNNLSENNYKKNINTKNNKYMQNIINADSEKKNITLSPSNLDKNNNFINIGNKKNNSNININIEEDISKKYMNNKFKEISNKIGNKIINFTEYHNDLKKNLNTTNKSRDSHLLLKSLSFYKQTNNNPVKLNPRKKELTINKPFNIPSKERRIYIPNQYYNSNKDNKMNNTVEIKDVNRNNNNISNYYKKFINNNNIININNNTSNVNVLNLKNASINIHFEKKDRCKGLSPERNINYIATVNSIDRNNKNTIKKLGNETEKNKNQKKNIKKKKPSLNRNNYPSYIKIYENSNKNNSNIITNRNDNRFYINDKTTNSKITLTQLTMSSSETHLPNDVVKFDKEITDNNSNMKIYLNKNKDNKDNRDTNSNKLHLNTDRSNDAYNIDNISKIIKIPIKDNSNKKNNKKIILPISTGSNSNSITQNKKCVKGIYIKPTLSRSKSKNKNKKSNSEAKTKCDYFLKNRNIISSNKKVKSITKSLNNEKHLYTPPCIFPIQDKYNLLLKINNTRKKVSKSANTLSDSSIDNSNIVKKKKKKIRL
jgi:hypothetical protein